MGRCGRSLCLSARGKSARAGEGTMSGGSSEETLTSLEGDGEGRAPAANPAAAATLVVADDDASAGAGGGGHGHDADLKGIRGVYRMKTAKKDVLRYQVRVWIKRGQLKNKESNKPWDEGNTRTKRNSGKRVHLGCFGTLSSSIHAFDVAEIFFKGNYAATNKPAATYDHSPVLRFLLQVVEDRTDLEEFMTVWKHLMQYRYATHTHTHTNNERERERMRGDRTQKALSASFPHSHVPRIASTQAFRMLRLNIFFCLVFFN